MLKLEVPRLPPQFGGQVGDNVNRLFTVLLKVVEYASEVVLLHAHQHEPAKVEDVFLFHGRRGVASDHPPVKLEAADAVVPIREYGSVAKETGLECHSATSMPLRRRLDRGGLVRVVLHARLELAKPPHAESV